MREVAELLLSWIATTWACFAILRIDERRSTRIQRERAWPDSTRLSAVVVFGALALPVHFGRTRRTFLGVLLGLALAVSVVLLSALAEIAVGAAFGDLPF